MIQNRVRAQRIISVLMAIIFGSALVAWVGDHFFRDKPPPRRAPIAAPVRPPQPQRPAPVPSPAPRDIGGSAAAPAAPTTPAPSPRPAPLPTPAEPAVPAPKSVGLSAAAPNAPTGVALAGAAAPLAEDGADIANALVFSPDRDGIRAAVIEAMPAIRACYEGWVEAAGPSAPPQGKLSVSFEVAVGDDQGRAGVRKASLLHSEMAHPFVEGCVLNAFSELVFSPPEGGVLAVTYPLEFSATDTPGGQGGD